MRKIHWDDGMSVGIDAIDNDHKALIQLISELSDAIENGCDVQLLTDVFNRLEDYVLQHFTREEALMAECEYPDLQAHIAQHRRFVEKVPALKQSLLTADSVEVAEEINLFLYDWLMNHIVGEDLNFAQLAYEKGLANRKPQLQESTLTGWLSHHVTLGQRIAMTTLLPVMAVVLLAVILLWQNLQQLNTVKQLIGFSELIPVVAEFTHSLQAERGLSIGALSSKMERFKDDLQKQRQHTDHLLKNYLHKVAALPENDVTYALKGYFQQLDQHLRELNQMRNSVDRADLLPLEVQIYYSLLIEDLQNTLDIFSSLRMDNQLDHQLTALNAIMRMKEAVGLKRALGVQAIEVGELDAVSYHRYLSLDSEQKSFFYLFQRYTSASLQQDWRQYYDDRLLSQVESLEARLIDAIQQKTLSEMDSLEWFAATTERMNKLHLITAEIINRIHLHQLILQRDSRQELFFTVAMLVMVLLFVFISTRFLNNSIIRPVRSIKHAMERLAAGHQDIRFDDTLADDELRQLVTSYERCRRSLLKASIASSITSRRQDIKLETRIREKNLYQQLASKDSLTGALNRRMFEELSQQEFLRAARYGRRIAILMLDIDHFKQINDNYGHAAGDQVLIQFYEACFSIARKTDIVARLGGEEFAVLLPETSLRDALLLAERMRKEIADLLVEVDDHSIKLTVSIGVAQWHPEHRPGLVELLAAADEALYTAKNSGRNQVAACSGFVE